MKERRAARIGTVSGLALLNGGTAFAAVAGNHHSIFATVLLGLLTLGMSHALAVEIQRQAHRGAEAGWCRHDTVNTALLACWAFGAGLITMLPSASGAVRGVGLALTIGYAVGCTYFVVERRRTVSAPSRSPASASEPPGRAPASPVSGSAPSR